MANITKTFKGTITKVDELGVGIGFAIICKINGEPYFDLHEDHIPEDIMEKAALEFMEGDRTVKVMHKGESAGKVVFALPLTEANSKALGIKTEKTGLIVGIKPDEDEIFQKMKDGTYGAFSMGGQAQTKPA